MREAEQNLSSHCFKASGTLFFTQKQDFQICWVLLREGELGSAPRFSTLLHSSSQLADLGPVEVMGRQWAQLSSAGGETGGFLPG